MAVFIDEKSVPVVVLGDVDEVGGGMDWGVGVGAWNFWGDTLG